MSKKSRFGKNNPAWKGGVTKIKRYCLVCGKEFITTQRLIKMGNGKFCSRSCYTKFYRGKPKLKLRRGKIFVCSQCGCKVYKPKAHIRNIKKHFCNRKCSANYYREHYLKKGSKHPNWKGGKPKCKICGREISYYAKKCVSCEAKTRITWNKDKKFPEFSKENHHNWKGGKGKCIDCGKPKGDYYSQRCPKCSHKYFKRENSPHWQGGISREPYPFDFNEELKELIRKRDDYKCQLCGCPQEENIEKLNVHHIDFIKENIDPKNLISLCDNCHPKTNYNREYWKNYFQQKTEVTNGISQ